MKHPDLPDFADVRGKHLLVALSGGADSVALLLLLAGARASENLTLTAVHVNHSIRGEDSLADAEFCRVLCHRHNIPFHLETVDVPAISAQTGEGIETVARRLRYDALLAVRQRVRADLIALAHHRDDQTETVLMHLLRGCGPAGIAGMERLSGFLYRPLLDLPKTALTAYLEERGVAWRTDRTNFIPDTPRNALRLHGLPALEESYPQAAAAIARYAEAAQVENRFMNRLTDEFLESCLECGAYGRRLICPDSADEAVLRRALLRICGSGCGHETLDRLIRLCKQPRGKTDISSSLTAERTPSALYFLPRRPDLPAPVLLNMDGVTVFGRLGEMEIHPCAAVPVQNDPFRQVLRKDVLADPVLRTRADGDRIRPLGCGEKLLSDFLTDRKIDRPLRGVLPLVTAGRRVLWAVGVGISEEAALLSGSDDAVSLEWRPYK